LAGWGEFPIVLDLAAVGLGRLGRHSVSVATEPAAEVHELAAAAAEGELRPVFPLARHLALANWAAYL
jgi:hypothetical protein